MSRKHKIFWKMIRAVGFVLAKAKFSYTYEIAKDLPENYIVLSNHVTDFDPIFVGLSFKRQMYFVASEHISRWKFAYKLLHFFFAPIMRYKGSVASSTVMEIMRKTRAGENVCLFAEGGRSWDGVTNPILPATGKMVKKAGCGLVTYKLVGGYFVSPNWSEGGTRRGYIHGAPVRVLTKEQLSSMSAEEINAVIREDLYEDAYARQEKDPKRYRGRRLAEKMENLMYICPHCGEIDSLHSKKDTVSCQSCAKSFTYDEYGRLHGLPYGNVKEMALRQREQMAELVRKNTRFTAASATLSTVENRQEQFLSQGQLTMDSRALRCGDFSLSMGEISDMAMHGRHALVFTSGKTYYELILEEGNNTLKFQHFFEENKKIKTEERVG